MDIVSIFFSTERKIHNLPPVYDKVASVQCRSTLCLVDTFCRFVRLWQNMLILEMWLRCRPIRNQQLFSWWYRISRLVISRRLNWSLASSWCNAINFGTIKVFQNELIARVVVSARVLFIILIIESESVF